MFIIVLFLLVAMAAQLFSLIHSTYEDVGLRQSIADLQMASGEVKKNVRSRDVGSTRDLRPRGYVTCTPQVRHEDYKVELDTDEDGDEDEYLLCHDWMLIRYDTCTESFVVEIRSNLMRLKFVDLSDNQVHRLEKDFVDRMQVHQWREMTRIELLRLHRE